MVHKIRRVNDIGFRWRSIQTSEICLECSIPNEETDDRRKLGWCFRCSAPCCELAPCRQPWGSVSIGENFHQTPNTVFLASAMKEFTPLVCAEAAVFFASWIAVWRLISRDGIARYRDFGMFWTRPCISSSSGCRCMGTNSVSSYLYRQLRAFQQWVGRMLYSR